MLRLFWVGLFVSISACADRSFTPTVPEALAVGTAFTVFAATSREPEPNGNFGFERSERLRLLELTVSIPPTHTPGTIKFAYANPNPRKEFTMAGVKEFDSPKSFRSRMSEKLRNSFDRDNEAIIFVHGYNATQAETAFRAAQLANDLELKGNLVVYSWPSRGSPLAYAYDNDSVLFARTGLETLMREVKKTGASRIVLVAHSMGSVLAMETLRQMDLREPGWPARNLGGVVLISPDLDVDVFRSQMKDLSVIPDPFVVFVSKADRILDLSARLRGTHKSERLGNIRNIEKVADLPINIVDTTAFSKGAGSAHFIPATSPALISIFQGARSVAETFGSEDLSIERMIVGSNVYADRASETVLKPN